jgi:NAD-dependent DNA ligase
LKTASSIWRSVFQGEHKLKNTETDYQRFHFKSRLEKSLNSLLGLIEGIAIDGQINGSEFALVRLWFEDHRDLQHRHPYNEIIPVLAEAIADGVLDAGEREDLKYLCERLTSSEYFSRVTADLQRLHAVVGGIAADGAISVEEMRALSDWLADHEQLKSCWPYDEIESLTAQVLQDGKVDEAEQKMLLSFFSEFLAVLDDRTIVSPLVIEGHASTIGALCAVAPEVQFEGATFCITGKSSKLSQSEFGSLVSRLGGEPLDDVSKKLNYLVVGANGNPCWAYACYGRKVEKAVKLRKEGVRLVILHENDFHDAVLDQ